jgi:hypothetical protein
VTTALSELAKRGVLRTDGETWVLSGEAPHDLLAFERESTQPAGQKAAPPAANG